MRIVITAPWPLLSRYFVGVGKRYWHANIRSTGHCRQGLLIMRRDDSSRNVPGVGGGCR